LSFSPALLRVNTLASTAFAAHAREDFGAEQMARRYERVYARALAAPRTGYPRETAPARPARAIHPVGGL